MSRATELMVERERAARDVRNAGPSRPSLAAAVRSLMKDAAEASPYRAHTPTGMAEPTAFIPVSAVRSMIACLSGESLPGLFDANGRLRRTPQAAPSSDEIKLDAAVIKNSRVARAGAGVVIMPEPFAALPVGPTGDVVMHSVPAFVRHVESANFATVDVDSLAEVTVSPSPITSVQIDWKTCIAKAVRFEIPRKDRMAYADQDALCQQIVAALTLGLARAADETLLSALAAKSLQPFSLAAVAAQDLRFAELRSLIGTAGAGAAVGLDGALRAAGVAGELTPDMAGTIVGAWDRAAVAIRDDVNIYFERTGTAGEMAVTAWASMQAQIPVANKFWTVA